jgi:ATP-binding cassette subfamily B protein
LESNVEQRGKNFSGGQKQRISIARTVAKKSKILIFDDSTSALDNITESKVQENIKKFTSATTIVVAQRISSVEKADRIIVIEEGRINGFDTHINLLKNNDIYRDIAISQIGSTKVNDLLKGGN